MVWLDIQKHPCLRLPRNAWTQPHLHSASARWGKTGSLGAAERHRGSCAPRGTGHRENAAASPSPRRPGSPLPRSVPRNCVGPTADRMFLCRGSLAHFRQHAACQPRRAKRQRPIQHRHLRDGTAPWWRTRACVAEPAPAPAPAPLPRRGGRHRTASRNHGRDPRPAVLSLGEWAATGEARARVRVCARGRAGVAWRGAACRCVSVSGP